MVARAPRILSTDRFKKVKDSLCVEEESGLLVIMPYGTRDHFFTLEGAAAECFLQLDGKLTLEKIAKKVSAKQKLPADRVLEDLLKLARDLLKAKLIEDA